MFSCCGMFLYLHSTWSSYANLPAVVFYLRKTATRIHKHRGKGCAEKNKQLTFHTRLVKVNSFGPISGPFGAFLWPPFGESKRHFEEAGKSIHHLDAKSLKKLPNLHVPNTNFKPSLTGLLLVWIPEASSPISSLKLTASENCWKSMVAVDDSFPLGIQPIFMCFCC